MTIRRVVLALLLALLALGTLALPRAYAGGTTSVVMIDPTAGRAVAAYSSDRAFRDVYAAVVGESRLRRARPASVATDVMPTVRLVWLAHDTAVAHVDEVHLTRSDGIWIERLSHFDGSPGHRWLRPVNAENLTAALTAVGLLGDGRPTATTSPSAEATPSPKAAPPTESAEPPAEVRAGALPMPAVAGLGAVGGLVLGGLVVGGWTRRRTS